MAKITPVRFYRTQGYISQYRQDPYLGYTNPQTEKTEQKESAPSETSPFGRILAAVIYQFMAPDEHNLKEVVLKDQNGEPVTATIVQTSKFTRAIMKDGEFLGTSICSTSNAPISGDFYPDYYKGKKYLFVNTPLHSSKKYKGIGTELMKEIVRMSKKMGMEGRVCLTASTIDPEIGSPIPFYYKCGFRSANSDFNENIAQHIEDGGKTPLMKSSGTMFLPKENVETLLAKSYK